MQTVFLLSTYVYSGAAPVHPEYRVPACLTDVAQSVQFRGRQPADSPMGRCHTLYLQLDARDIH